MSRKMAWWITLVMWAFILVVFFKVLNSSSCDYESGFVTIKTRPCGEQ